MARQATSGQKRAPPKTVAPKAVVKAPAFVPEARPSRGKSPGTTVERRQTSSQSVGQTAGQQLKGLTDAQKVATLLKEREQLRSAVDALQSRLVAAETRQAQLADRIAWALDTLNDVLRDKA